VHFIVVLTDGSSFISNPLLHVSATSVVGLLHVQFIIRQERKINTTENGHSKSNSNNRNKEETILNLNWDIEIKIWAKQNPDTERQNSKIRASLTYGGPEHT
jgi:hypothetical protein